MIKKLDLEGRLREAVLRKVNLGEYDPDRLRLFCIKMVALFDEEIREILGDHLPKQKRVEKTEYLFWVIIDTLTRSEIEVDKNSATYSAFYTSIGGRERPAWIDKKMLVDEVKYDLRRHSASRKAGCFLERSHPDP